MKKIGILWGGGLGDLLMIRPLLLSLQARGDLDMYFLTAASHAAGLFREFCAPAKIVQLSRSAVGLADAVRRWGGFFDLVYAGPYPTPGTRLLAWLLRPRAVWSRQHRNADPFMLEQVLRDCRDLGLPAPQAGPAGFQGFLPWPVAPDSTVPRPYLVLHAGSKQRWQTTRWPAQCWSALAGMMLEQTSYRLVFVGTASEQELVQGIAAGLPARDRVTISLSATLQHTAALIASAKGVVCHNSGILHLAAFLGATTACITGSSAPYWRPPYPWVKNITASACGRACNRYRCPIPWYRAKCIMSLTVGDVWAGLRAHGMIGEGD